MNDATTSMDLEAWDAEGGAPGPQPVRRDPVAVVRVPERWLLVRLGAALVREWNRLPMPLQRAV